VQLLCLQSESPKGPDKGLQHHITEHTHTQMHRDMHTQMGPYIHSLSLSLSVIPSLSLVYLSLYMSSRPLCFLSLSTCSLHLYLLFISPSFIACSPRDRLSNCFICRTSCPLTLFHACTRTHTELSNGGVRWLGLKTN
jgi:hypothetical protein